MTLNIGDKIPALKALAPLKGANAILYFYPKDDTPGCTLEACGFRDNLPRFTKANAKVFGISKDDAASHAKFTKKYELPFQLLSDEDGAVCEAFGTWVEKNLYGRKYMGIERATFLIDKEGTLRHIWRNVKVSGHVEEVLAAAKNL